MRTLSPVSSSTSRSAVSSIASPWSGVPFGKTQVPSAWRPVRTTSRAPSRWRRTTPPAAIASRTRGERRVRTVGMGGSSRKREKESLEESGVVDDEREIAMEELGGAAGQHHARQEDLEVLHDGRDLGVDRELEGDELFLAADLDLRGRDRVVDAVVDVERRRFGVPHAAPVDVALVGDD